MIQSQLKSYQNYSQTPFGLGDFAFSQYIDCGTASVAKTPYDLAVCTVWNRINWNQSKLNPLNWFLQKYEIGDVRAIINAYYNISKVSGKVWNTSQYKSNNLEQIELYNSVKNTSLKQKDGMLLEVLSQLEYAAKDGSIAYEVYDPLKGKQTETDRSLPPEAESYKNSSIAEGLTSLFNNANWIIPVALVGVGLAIVYPYVKPLIKK